MEDASLFRITDELPQYPDVHKGILLVPESLGTETSAEQCNTKYQIQMYTLPLPSLTTKAEVKVQNSSAMLY